MALLPLLLLSPANLRRFLLGFPVRLHEPVGELFGARVEKLDLVVGSKAATIMHENNIQRDFGECLPTCPVGRPPGWGSRKGGSQAGSEAKSACADCTETKGQIYI